jgi:mannose-1-phosphate guanylyltransferase
LRALLLAAGLGTRLQPLTNYLPKCLVPIRGRPLIDYWLETLVDQGVEKVLINTHYMAPIVQRYLNQSTWLPYVTFVHEETLMGTGGTVLANRTFFKDETFIVAHADNLTIFNLRDFVNQHAARPKATELTMMLFETPDPQSCGIVSLGRQGIVQSFHEKVVNPPGNLANGAVYVMEPSVVDWMAGLGKTVIDISTEVLPCFLGKIFSYRNARYHRDIGSMKSWCEANEDFSSMPPANQNKKIWREILADANPQLINLLARYRVAH